SQWISPLQAEHTAHGLIIFAPNQYVLDAIKQQFLATIERAVAQLATTPGATVSLVVGTMGATSDKVAAARYKQESELDSGVVEHASNLNVNFTFDNFVEGKSN